MDRAYSLCSRSVLRSRDHKLALVAKDLEGFVEDRSQLGEYRAATNATAFVMLDLWLWNAHPIHFPVDVLPTQRERFRRCAKPTVATRHHLFLNRDCGLRATLTLLWRLL